MKRIKKKHIYGITRKKNSSMGNKRMIMFLMVLFFFYRTASLFPQSKTFPNSVNLQEKNKEIYEYNSSSDGDTTSGIAHRSAVGHGTVGRTANGGKSGGSAENGNGGGGSRIPGGAAVIPLYVAAGNHRNSHSAGTCYLTGLSPLSATILASLFMCI